MSYSPPNTASVAVTYTPNFGLAGSDVLSFAIQDQYGAFALGVVKI